MRAKRQRLLSLSVTPFYGLLVLHAFSAAAEKDVRRDFGVVVEDAKEPSEGERDGPHKGDVIIGWTRRGQRHVIASPFDVEWIEATEHRHTAIRLDGLRAGKKLSWVLLGGFSDLTFIPREAEFFSLHSKIAELTRNKRFDEIAGTYDNLARTRFLSLDVRVWTLVDGARAFVSAHESRRAGLLFQRASQLSVEATLVVQSRVLEGWATFLEDQREFDRSAGVLEKALEINGKLAPASLACAGDLHSLARLTWQKADSTKAMQYVQKELKIRSRLDSESIAYAQSLNYAGVFAQDQGDLPIAEQYHKAALRILQRLDPHGIDSAKTYSYLGATTQRRGDLTSAEKYDLLAIRISTEIDPHRYQISYIWSNLGAVAEARGDLEKAESYYSRALDIQRGAGKEEDCAITLNNLAMVAIERSDLQRGEGFVQQALNLQRRLLPGSTYLAETLDTAGRLKRAQGHLAEAEGTYREAVAIIDKVSPNSLMAANVKAGLGDVLIDLRILTKAQDYCQQAAKLRESLAPSSGQYAESLAALARIARLRRDGLRARDYYERALKVLDEQVTLLGGRRNELQFRTKVVDYYSNYVDFLVQEGDNVHALEVVERMRARTFLEMLQDARVDARTADPTLMSKRRSLLELLSSLSDQRIRMLASTNRKNDVAVLNERIDSIMEQLDRIDYEIARLHPRTATLTHPRMLRASEIQGLLDDQTVMLTYLLGEKCSYVFVVTSKTLDVFRLPDRDVISRAGKRLYQFWTRRPDDKTAQNLQGPMQQPNQEPAEFAKIVLEKPSQTIVLKKRVVVVADGVLQYIPFAALPLPGRDTLLLTTHEIVNLPSASVLSVLRAQEAGEHSKEIGKSVLVFADPVFSASDPRVQHRMDAQAVDGSRTVADINVSRDIGREDLSRLRYSRIEANYIVSVEDGAREALDFNANRSLATSPEISRYKVIHFATHGVLDSTHPELSALVLSLVDPDGRPRPGILTLQDVYSLNLRSDLAVLSGCQTALGNEIKGEGLVGLTRGFMYAGAKRVVSSLWSVDDAGTAELMRLFYLSMTRNPGISAPAALRAAQLNLSRSQRWHLPYYWAAFTIQGDWETTRVAGAKGHVQ